MDQVGSTPGTNMTTEAASPTVGTWDRYYREASRRRRASGGGRQLRIEKRRRRLRERLGIGISALLVSAMTLAFYLVLTR